MTSNWPESADLRARLLRAGALRHRKRVPKPPNEQTTTPKTAQPPLESLVQGDWVSGSGGRCFVSERLYPLDHEHGQLPLGRLLAVPSAHWAPFVLDADRGRFEMRQAVFVDTETTGLARGTGTVAFLVGIGLYEQAGFRVRQYFMPGYGDEQVLLELVGSDLEKAGGLVSFNGRSFDWPILETRYILNRQPLPEAGPHLDLLLLARRLWRRTQPSCALSALESSVIDVRRETADVPGFLIPQLYQDYLQYGRAEPMARVFYHNEIDILSMVTLAGHIGDILDTSLAGESSPSCDYVSLGILYERIGQPARALQAYRMAARDDSHPDLIAMAHKCLSFLLKRSGRIQEAAALWETQVGGSEAYPYIELAKYCEHTVKDLGRARRVVHEAIAWTERQSEQLGQEKHDRLVAGLGYRLSRLERRIRRQVEAPCAVSGDEKSPPTVERSDRQPTDGADSD